jgi:2-polyprenyl-3-methyl-5-hydroxy-6-metoxy-1,4-benzoquinol methylase
VDLGMSPLANSYLQADQLQRMEPFYPLHAYVCHQCLLVQLEEFENPDHIFSDYAYFSSYSESYLAHARSYTQLMIDRFDFGPTSHIVEIASNDGYLLQYFQDKNIPVLGIEPAANVAEVAKEKGIPTLVKFFGIETARELVSQKKQADLLLGNNVLAHVPDINDFVGGMKILLKPQGIITIEFPHLVRLMAENLFDTIYHEHFSYFSFYTVQQIFGKHGLTLFDVEEVETHGGSLRIYGRHEEDITKPVQDRVIQLQNREKEAGFESLDNYLTFAGQVAHTKRQLLKFLISAKEEGKKIAAYGAPAKGNTLFNYCGIKTDFIDFTVDRSPHKQNHFLPGSHIPIYHPDKIREIRPDYLLILAWNLKDEVMEQMSYIREWDGKFVVLIPEVKVF